MTTGIRVSPQGGLLNEGCVSEGTLRTQDLLRRFADELERLKPFNSRATVQEARDTAEGLDEEEVSEGEAQEVLQELIEELERLASPHGLSFGAQEGDGACFGWWRTEDA